MADPSVKVVLVAKTLVFNEKGEVLVLLRSQDDDRRPSTWDLPGGSVEQDEDPNEAAAREIKEEAGIDITDLLILSINSTNSDGYKVTFIFKARADKDEITLSHEHDEWKWVSPAELIETDIPEKYKSAVRALYY
jgi:8-oxo-dGTP diphosphatase